MIKAIVRHVTHGDLVYDALMFWCPGCEHLTEDGMQGGLHMLPVTDAGSKPKWEWDGNLDAPTLNPSILTRTGPDGSFVCHSFLRAGVFEFLGDCTHQYAGQHVPLPALPEWVL